MGVIHINSDYEFDNVISKHRSSNKLVVCDFFAEWCGPCRYIAPFFESLSDRYPDTIFLKIDVDTCGGTSQNFDVSAMPTFILLMNGNELQRIQGANPQKLEESVKKNVQKATSSVANTQNVASQEERLWLQQFVPMLERMKVYEDEVTQTLAQSLMPVEELTALSTISGIINHFELAKNILKWFSHFFQWVNKLDCEECNAEANRIAGGQCTMEEKKFGANNVELYTCSKCQKEIRFPRFNDPAKLLETRKGRCGEYANCFALCTRAMGLKTRWVTDNLDHVWVEVWSDQLFRWIHCDPCENVIDLPLMYHKGWKKQHAYVFAFANNHMQDVTWRYCFDYSAAMKRRNKCRENVLLNFNQKLNQRLAKEMSIDQKQQLETMLMTELVEFLSPKNQLRNTSAQNQGRISGNETWKLARGEMGKNCLDAEQKSKVVKLDPTECQGGLFRLSYDCTNDTYSWSGNNSVIGWNSLTYKAENIFRKVEHDWKKTYLSRGEGTLPGTITWKIEHPKCMITKIELELQGNETFENGRVQGTLCCGDFCAEIKPKGLEIDNIGASDYTEITFELSGGKGDVAWQHAQLFRTNNREPRDNMILKIFIQPY